LLGESPIHRLRDRKIDALVTLGTPIRPDYTPRDTQVKRWVNVFSRRDVVQVLGGGDGMRVKFAGREVQNSPAINIDATMFARSYGVTAHSELWQKPAVWKTLVAGKLEAKPEYNLP
jgi:hypothetical protein